MVKHTYLLTYKEDTEKDGCFLDELRQVFDSF